MGQLFNDSPRAMYEYLVAQHPSMKFVWVFKDEQTPISGPGVRVRRMSFKYWYYMARAKYLVQIRLCLISMQNGAVKSRLKLYTGHFYEGHGI
ncbi:CDP-glycerol glycerophosphotransferase [Lactiplantibacillus plantarum subsp. plantarum]|uniref:CDP-glycerol glycerophosphotransferase n=1 Tax=Lactiplantibacillus plantarum subsp. plantarum TaxID=337330 RepID=A0A2S3U0T6_LACPN|nr:CDP-glycerol glycerophosphotransferase [Lactiplantibacillus plantarum subsp. plantarum]